MKTRKEILEFALKFPEVYVDAPFHDDNWQLARLKKNKKTFMFIYEYKGRLQINIKCQPEMLEYWRQGFDSVIPAYHMNKNHWNTVILDGTVPEGALVQMIEDSYGLAAGKKKNE